MSEKEVTKKPVESTEHWWSSLDPNHMVVIDTGDGAARLIRFEGYNYSVDTSTEDGKKVSQGLHNSGREGRDLFVVGRNYGDHQLGDKVGMMKLLREVASRSGGVERIRGLFTNKELVEAGIKPNSGDVDELIMLALKTKNITGEVKDESVR